MMTKANQLLLLLCIVMSIVAFGCLVSINDRLDSVSKSAEFKRAELRSMMADIQSPTPPGSVPGMKEMEDD